MDTSSPSSPSSDNNVLSKMDYQDNSAFVTPKKAILNALMLTDIKQLQQRSPAYNNGDFHEINLNHLTNESFHILKERYLLANFNDDQQSSLSNLKCTDIYTELNYICKIINENFDKVTLAYLNLQRNLNDNNKYDHQLIRQIHDAVKIDKNRTFLVIKPNIYGDLHSYVKVQRRLNETETRQLFGQICETVRLCHQNGIVVRDLKLKKFFFNNYDRTQLQYESLEGSFILNDSNDDTLTEKIGCPLYVAPELITPNTTYAGKAADMWSLGIILYTILVGRYPFSDANGQTLFNKILYGDLFIPNFLSSKVKCLIKSLLHKNPDKRLTSDDILYHSWFMHKDTFNRYDFSDDQFVPNLNLENENNNSYEMIVG